MSMSKSIELSESSESVFNFSVFVLTGFDICVFAIIRVSSRSRNDLKNKRIEQNSR